MLTLLVTAAAMGLAGSLHCAVMCGPLVVASSRRSSSAGYFFGRQISYLAVGALMGSIGKHALCILPVRPVELAAVALVVGFAALTSWRRLRPDVIPLGKRTPFLARVASILPRRGVALGLVTGILPCGMLVPAWLLAAGAGGALPGALAMGAFAVASLPGLLAPVLGRPLLDRLGRRLGPTAQGLAWAALAVWLALRPLLAAAHHHH